MRSTIKYLLVIVFTTLTGCTSMRKVYETEKAELLKRNNGYESEIFTEELINDLPEPLKKYLRVCGYLDTKVPKNATVHWRESYLKMAPDKDWTKLETLQFNSVRPVARVAYMKFSSMPVAARDLYRDGYGEINGKLFNVFRVVFDNSKEVAQSALITIFCEFMFIPGYILSENVTWERVDDYSVRGTLTDNGIEVTGLFRFSEEGLFTHFETDDRYYSTGRNCYKKIKFSALVESYKNQGVIKIAEDIKIVWNLPDGDFEYFKGTVDSVEFNVVQ